jgi:hypothetical protein
LSPLPVFIDAPAGFVPRAQWVLDTLLAPLGRRAEPVGEREAAGGCALAYATAPVPGVPTLSCSADAVEMLAAGRPLPPESFARHESAAGWPAGAFAAPADGYAAPFDPVASAFVLLACWDEHASAERDRFGRLPYSASVFAAEPALALEDPVVDGYVAALRHVLGPRLAGLGLEPLPRPGWMWSAGETAHKDGDRPCFAVALTHDLDNLRRWTLGGFAQSARRLARATRDRDAGSLAAETRDLTDWLTHHLPHHTDPCWTFPQLLAGEDERGARSTFYVLPRRFTGKRDRLHAEYQRDIVEVFRLLSRERREVGLHAVAGLEPANDAPESTAPDAATLDEDLRDLERRAGGAVRGVRYHYLRCLYHESLPVLDAAGLDYDTSLAFAEREGFRCGCSFPFHPYDVRAGRPLRLLELPLAIMDTSLLGSRYRALDAAAAERVCTEVLARVRAAGGGVSLLWHNNRFDRRSAQGYDDLYWTLVDDIQADGGLVATAGDVARRWRASTT